MRKLLIATAIALAASGSACAKLRVSLKIDFSNEKAKRELQEAIEARINSTDRYTIASEAAETDLLLAVSCLAPESVPVTCNSDVSYFPYKDLALSIPVEVAESMAMSRNDTGYIASNLMNHFIDGTTDAILKERKSFVREAIQLFCYNDPTECKK
jgi:hypothetical protein